MQKDKNKKSSFSYKELVLGALIGFVSAYVAYQIDQINKTRQSSKTIGSAVELEKIIAKNYILDLEESIKLPQNSQVVPQIFKYGQDINFYFQFDDDIVYLDKETQKEYFKFLLSIYRCSYAREVFYFGLNKSNNKIIENMDALDFYKIHLSKLINTADSLKMKLDTLSKKRLLFLF